MATPAGTVALTWPVLLPRRFRRTAGTVLRTVCVVAVAGRHPSLWGARPEGISEPPPVGVPGQAPGSLEG